MKAIRFHDYGGPEVMQYEEVPVPVPAADEVLVRVHAMGVNPVDWKIREGHVRKRIQIPLPAVPGGDISGVIEKCGSAVSGFNVGQPVIGMLGLLGAYAEFVAVKPALLAGKPASIDHVHAASVPLAALTAWQGLFDVAALKAGQSVLVHAAAGGVGSFAVQLARQAGADVAGTCSAGNLDFVRSLGATEAIDYTRDSYASHAGRYDVVVDTMGGDVAVKSLDLLKVGGILVGVAPPSEAVVAQANAAGKRAAGLQVKPNGAQLAQIAALIDAGKVRTTVAASFPLSQAGRAHEQSKLGHTRGKIVLTSGG